jgi:hypothetical protein
VPGGDLRNAGAHGSGADDADRLHGCHGGQVNRRLLPSRQGKVGIWSGSVREGCLIWTGQNLDLFLTTCARPSRKILLQLR